VATTLNYTVDKGESWKRLVIIKDRRTHRKRVPTAAAASVRIADGVLAGDYIIPSEINYEGGVLLSLLPENTEWLPVGDHSWDLVVTVSESALLTSTPLIETLVVRGTLSVLAYENITPMAVDTAPLDPLEAVDA
jgi:hypothetical protein